MRPRSAIPLLASLLGLGCAPKPAPTAAVPPPAGRAPRPTIVVKAVPAPVVALVEPYLVPVAAPTFPAPSPLHGRILPDLGNVPVLPSPPTQTEPVAPSPTRPASPSSPAPTPRATTVPQSVVRLFEDERARSVDDARRTLIAASARASQTAVEAKRQWGFVKEGFVAQKQAETADAAAKEASGAQADAQKSLEDALRRQRNARHDVEAAFRAVAAVFSPFALAQRTLPTTSFQALPGAFRLSVLGGAPVTITLQNGTLGRRLPTGPGEAGAWFVRCPDPARLRVGVGDRAATVVIRPLPETTPAPKV